MESARKSKTITINTEGRDKGKSFFIEEWSAKRIERWSYRVLAALGATGADMSGFVGGSGMQGLARAGFDNLLRIDPEVGWDLLDELMTAVAIPLPNGTRPLVEEDIAEFATRAFLKMEVLTLHMGFSKAADPSKDSNPTTSAASTSSNTSTSPHSSAPQYHPAKRRSRN
jgi:hypothetical protein